MLDHTLDDDENWFDAISDLESHPFCNLFDEFGNYHKHVIVQEIQIAGANEYTPTFYDALAKTPSNNIMDSLDSIVYDANRACLMVHHGNVMPSSPHLVHTKVPDYKKFHHFFGWTPTEVIKKMFKVMTQFVHMPMSTVLKKRYKSPNPAVNVHHHDEPVMTDTVFSDTPAIDGGETAA
jgi:hypothetical protein